MVGIEVDDSPGEPKIGQGMKTRILDHIDLRVKDFKRAMKFYRKFLPALGFTHDTSDDEWGTFYAVGRDRPSEFFGFTADPKHKPNGTRIAFWAETPEEVDRLTAIAREAGAQNIDGPELVPEYRPGYYAVFFDDPEGNNLEICSRKEPIVKK